MANGSGIEAVLLEQLSALADGELDDPSAASACAGWRSAAHIRGTWHAYQLIGDVLRSDDLAVDPGRDAAFLDAFRERLAREPVVVAPRLDALRRPSEARADRDGARAASSGRWMWKAGSAVAAGFVAVAGVFMLTRTEAPGASATAVLARADVPADVPAAVSADVPADVPAAVSGGASELQPAALESNMATPATPATPVMLAAGNVIRDARLDRYLAAHKQFAGSSALVMPSAFLRNATIESPGR